LLLVSVGAAIECGIYAVGSFCILRLRSRVDRKRPFTLVAGRPLAMFGAVVFSLLFLATAFADPKNSKHFSVLPFSVIAVLGALSTTYVHFVVPRLQRQASARSAAARPRRRPERPSSDDRATSHPGEERDV
jgi:uncharacterized membrane protein